MRAPHLDVQEGLPLLLREGGPALHERLGHRVLICNTMAGQEQADDVHDVHHCYAMQDTVSECCKHVGLASTGMAGQAPAASCAATRSFLVLFENKAPIVWAAQAQLCPCCQDVLL